MSEHVPRRREAAVAEDQIRRPVTADATAVAPRLLNVRDAALYLSVSTWTIRDWVAAGILEPVALPALRAREGDRRKARLRRLLFDRAALDGFVDRLQGAHELPGLITS